MEAFNLAEKRINNMNNNLSEVEKDKRSAEDALDIIERQVEGQQVLLHQAEDQLATSKGQITALKKKLEEAKKVRDQAEQESYNVRVAETEKALSAKVSRVRRNYCLQVWNEAFNQARVEPFLHLGKQKVYTTLLLSMHQVLPVPRLTPPPMW